MSVKEYQLQYQKQYRQQNKKFLSDKAKIYYQRNKKQMQQDAKKTNSALFYLGCSISFLKSHLEKQFRPGMTWKNHGEWHIDHIKPICSFNLQNENELKICFNYTNLQPLWAVANRVKGGRH